MKNTKTTVKVTVKANADFDNRSALLDIVSGGRTVKSVEVIQGYVEKASASVSSLTSGAQETTLSFTVTANAPWNLTASADWITPSPANGEKGDTEVTVAFKENDTEARPPPKQRRTKVSRWAWTTPTPWASRPPCR